MPAHCLPFSDLLLNPKRYRLHHWNSFGFQISTEGEMFLLAPRMKSTVHEMGKHLQRRPSTSWLICPGNSAHRFPHVWSWQVSFLSLKTPSPSYFQGFILPSPSDWTAFLHFPSPSLVSLLLILSISALKSLPQRNLPWLYTLIYHWIFPL